MPSQTSRFAPSLAALDGVRELIAADSPVVLSGHGSAFAFDDTEAGRLPRGGYFVRYDNTANLDGAPGGGRTRPVPVGMLWPSPRWEQALVAAVDQPLARLYNQSVPNQGGPDQSAGQGVPGQSVPDGEGLVGRGSVVTELGGVAVQRVPAGLALHGGGFSPELARGARVITPDADRLGIAVGGPVSEAATRESLTALLAALVPEPQRTQWWGSAGYVGAVALGRGGQPGQHRVPAHPGRHVRCRDPGPGRGVATPPG